MIASPGVNHSLNADDTEKWLPELEKSAIVYFSGYSLINDEVGGVIRFLMAKLKGKSQIWFNPGSPDIAAGMEDVIRSYVDVLVLNEPEARRALKAHAESVRCPSRL